MGMAKQPRARAYGEIAEFFASAPTQEQILQLHLSDVARNQLRGLPERNEAGILTPDERVELDTVGEVNLFLEYVRSIILRQRSAAAARRKRGVNEGE